MRASAPRSRGASAHRERGPGGPAPRAGRRADAGPARRAAAAVLGRHDRSGPPPGARRPRHPPRASARPAQRGGATDAGHRRVGHRGVGAVRGRARRAGRGDRADEREVVRRFAEGRRGRPSATPIASCATRTPARTTRWPSRCPRCGPAGRRGGLARRRPDRWPASSGLRAPRARGTASRRLGAARAPRPGDYRARRPAASRAWCRASPSRSARAASSDTSRRARRDPLHRAPRRIGRPCSRCEIAVPFMSAACASSFCLSPRSSRSCRIARPRASCGS